MIIKVKDSFFVILVLYAFPIALAFFVGAILGISLYSVQFVALGVATISLGSLALYFKLKDQPKNETPISPEVIHEMLQDTPQENLTEELLLCQEENAHLRQEIALEQAKNTRIYEESLMQRQRLDEKLEEELEKNVQLTETLIATKTLLDRKQEEMEKLGGKIHDLTFEIKTLVQIAELNDEKEPPPQTLVFKSEPPFFEHSEDAKKQLRRCLDIAQKITGSYHIGGYQSRFRDMAIDHYALDLRRLCDSLRSEKGATVIVYSPKESKLLFINNHIKTLLGYNPEKFVQDFETIVQEGLIEWKKSVSQLARISETKTSLIIKNKQNEDVVIQCLLGMIPTGAFKNHVLGILYA